MIELLLITLLCGPIPTAPPASPDAMAPSLTATTNGAWLTWLEPRADAGVLELRAAFRGHGADTKWTAPITVTRRSDFFANWADVPRLGVGGDGSLYATWLQQSGPGTYAYDIGIARSTDGQSWTMLGTLNDDRVLGEHGFVSMLPDGNGVRAFWLDGRAMSGDGHDGHGGGDMSLRTALVGASISASTVLDERVCECCPTAAAQLPLGTAVVVRDRGTEEERDIAIVRSVEGVWSKPVAVSTDNWRINGCPVNGPCIEADGARVAVVWFSNGGERPGLSLAWSNDGGATFGTPHQVDDRNATGRPALALLPDGALVAWFDQDGTGQWLRAAVVDNAGNRGPTEVLARVPEGRRAGVPQLAILGDHVLLTWVAQDRKKGLDSLLLPVDTFPQP